MATQPTQPNRPPPPGLAIGIEAAREGGSPAPLDRLLGASPAIQRLKRATLQAARSDLPVLIEGPTGAGKELVARTVHDLGARARRPFVTLNCAALPTALFESELFGHVKGAFTGASADRAGLALRAHQGTLFLDEVSELVPEAQAKLLRFLQALEIRPVGGDEVRHVDVRVIAATNRSLHSAVLQRRFREDLYYRLAVVHVGVPSLIERGGDIGLLARAMLEAFAPRLGRAVPQITTEAYAQLDAHTWRGNVRELENVVKRTLADLEGAVITLFKIAETDGFGLAPDRAALEAVLRQHEGNVTEAARALGISRPTLYKRLDQLGLNLEVYRSQRPATAKEGRGQA